MSNAFNRKTGELRTSVNTPDYDPMIWIIDPDLSAVDGVPLRYLKCDANDRVIEMTDDEKIAADALLSPPDPGELS